MDELLQSVKLIVIIVHKIILFVAVNLKNSWSTTSSIWASMFTYEKTIELLFATSFDTDADSFDEFSEQASSGITILPLSTYKCNSSVRL